MTLNPGTIRRVERISSEWEWVPCKFEELVNDDQFRMFEPSGDPVVWGEDTVFIARSDAYRKHHEADEHNAAGERWTIDSHKQSEHIDWLENGELDDEL